MASDLIANTVRGSIFGAALTAAGVYAPKVIVDQMLLREFHMMKVFLTASASSALILAVMRRRSGSACSAPHASSLGLFGQYDGNIVGGAMIGAGMALTGACPGTVLVQTAVGIPSAIPVFAGAVTGGIAYERFVSGIKQSASQPEIDDIPTKFHVDPNVTLLAYEALMLSAILAFSGLQATPKGLLNPVIGGLAVGAAQFGSVALTNTTLGVSAAFGDVGKWFWWAVDYLQGNHKGDRPKPPFSSIQFVLSLMAGTYLLTSIQPEYALVSEQMSISPITGFIGGAVLILGARIAGGCTSGHGISGMAMLSVSSIVSVAAMFGTGIITGLALYR